jgi:hypothetical protein
LPSWLVQGGPIDEDEGGTYYTEYSDFDPPPPWSRGLYSLPAVALTIGAQDNEDAMDGQVYLELENEDGDVLESILILDCEGDGGEVTASNVEGPMALFPSDYEIEAQPIAKGRFKIVSSGEVHFPDTSGNITKVR